MRYSTFCHVLCAILSFGCCTKVVRRASFCPFGCCFFCCLACFCKTRRKGSRVSWAQTASGLLIVSCRVLLWYMPLRFLLFVAFAHRANVIVAQQRESGRRCALFCIVFYFFAPVFFFDLTHAHAKMPQHNRTHTHTTHTHTQHITHNTHTTHNTQHNKHDKHNKQRSGCGGDRLLACALLSRFPRSRCQGRMFRTFFPNQALTMAWFFRASCAVVPQLAPIVQQAACGDHEPQRRRGHCCARSARPPTAGRSRHAVLCRNDCCQLRGLARQGAASALRRMGGCWWLVQKYAPR